MFYTIYATILNLLYMMNTKYAKTLVLALTGALCAALFAACTSANCKKPDETKTINIADFGAKPDGSDSTPALQKALIEAKKHPHAHIKFGKGTYAFGGDLAKDYYIFASNNDEGLKRVIFPIVDFNGLTIEGEKDTLFMFYGNVNPFLVRNSKNVSFKNFACDLFNSPHAEAIVLDTFEDGVILRIKDGNPYVVDNGLLQFKAKPNPLTSEVQRPYRYGGILEFNTKEKRPEYNTGDYFPAIRMGTFRAEKLGLDKVKLYYKRLNKAVKGNTIVFTFSGRPHSTFSVDESENVLFKNITIYEAYGMGIIAQNSANIAVDSCVFTAGKDRVISCAADATHFVNCTGKIILNGNRFEQMMDDATNIHGIYERIRTIESPNTFVSELVHVQQYGFKTFKANDTIEFVDKDSMITKATAKIKSVETINKQFKRVVLDGNIPENVIASDAVAKIRDYPEIIITNNIVQKNRARGMLLNCRGKTTVENNVFANGGTALLFEGDACYWFEQGGVRNCTIRNNVFENNYYAKGWGTAIIGVGSRISKDKEISRYNRNIIIENNTFKKFDDTPMLYAVCIDNLKWLNNRVEKTEAFPPKNIGKKPFILDNSSNIEIK